LWRDNLSFLLIKIEYTEKNELPKISEIAPALTGRRINPAIHVKLSKTAEKPLPRLIPEQVKLSVQLNLLPQKSSLKCL
jgi:hypothetical protein